MPESLSSPPSQEQIERLLRSLSGVESARAVLSGDGRVLELHVLATSALHPKQVVRNVESALNAGLGLEVDRRKISVAQVDMAEAAGGSASAASSSAHPLTDVAIAEEPEASRLVFHGLEVSRPGSRRARCAVTLGLADERYHGAGEGTDTPQGRAEAAARAVVQALANASGGDTVGLEGARVVESEGRQYVVVAAHLVNRRPATELSGAAIVERSPEEAAIMATLQATNRWNAPENG